LKIFSSKQVRDIDAYTIASEPISSLDLMERAARQMFNWLQERYTTDRSFVIFAGPGNNGGDALVLARMLTEAEYPAELYLMKISDRLSGDASINLQHLKEQSRVNIHEISSEKDIREFSPAHIILDGIFGSGLGRPVEGLTAAVIRHLNDLPNLKIAIDIPSGLFGEDNTGNHADNILKADITLSLQFPSLSFFYSENEQYVGRLEIIPIGLHPDAIENTLTNKYFLTADFIASLLKARSRFSHKGTHGHVLLIAGSYGMMGAAVLGAKAGLRTGSGLLTVHVPRFGYQILQTSVPEALIDIDQSDIIFTGYPQLKGYSAVGIGPAIGTRTNSARALHSLINEVKLPLLIDADGLNILSENKDWLKELPSDTILTPHPGEFERLAGKTSSAHERNALQIEFSKEYGVITVLKGANSSICFPDGSCYFNTTGNPGMATAGSGDVLTGIILSLLGQGYIPGNAALLGVYLHGLAGDFALEKSAEEAVIASDITDHLGTAFRKLKQTEK